MTRDPLLWPFASNSIWNMPIGSMAHYVKPLPHGMPTYNDIWTPMPQCELERICLTPNAPILTINYSDVGWNGGDRCVPTNSGIGGGLPMTVPAPTDWTVPNSGNNNPAAFLAPDGRTILQCQPFTRCNPGQSATAIIAFNDVDLYGLGITGAHGGSGLSCLGGTIRMGELRPGGQMRHALKLVIDSSYVYYHPSNSASAYRWPAIQSDSGWEGYGSNNPKQYRGMRPGSLMAIPSSLPLSCLPLVSEPGKQLAWTLQNYGAYLVDATGPEYSISVESGPAGDKPTEFAADWGYPMEARIRDNTPWSRDFQTCMGALWLVDNNTVNTIGGGGTPLQPMAPPL